MVELVVGLLSIAVIVGFAFALARLEVWWYRRHRTPEEAMRDAMDDAQLAIGEYLIPAFQKLGEALTTATIAFEPLVETMRAAFAEQEEF